MAGLDDHQVLAMLRMRAVTIGRDNPAHHAVIEGKGPEMLGNQDDREALAFIGTKGTRRHDLACLESE